MQDIVIDGATVAIDGPHAFNSLLLTNGAVLTHSPCTATEMHKLDLTVCDAVVVSANGASSWVASLEASVPCLKAWNWAVTLPLCCALQNRRCSES
jgi:hypothetical protein